MSKFMALSERLVFIEQKIYWCSTLKRVELEEKFKISATQAIQDLTDYKKIAPKNIIYKKSKRHYTSSDDFTFIFDDNKPENILNTLYSSYNNYFLKYPKFTHNINPEILKDCISALFNTFCLDISYISPTSGLTKRIIKPVALGISYNRYYIRSFCFNKNEYRDFILSRIINSKVDISKRKPIPADLDALTQVSVVVRPYSKLTEEQSKMIEKEYGMIDGVKTFNVPKSTLYYFLYEIHLLPDQIKVFEVARKSSNNTFELDSIERKFREFELINKDIYELL